MDAFERNQFRTAIADQGGLSRGLKTVLDALVSLTPEGAPLVAKTDALASAISAREERSISPESLRKRVERLNAALEDAEALFCVQTKDGGVRASPKRAWTERFESLAVGDSLAKEQDDEIRINPATKTRPRAAPSELEPSLLVFVSYTTLSGVQGKYQDDFYERLDKEINYRPPLYKSLPKIELWRDRPRLDTTSEGDPQLDENCKRAFLVVAMLSSRYPEREYCQREIDWFLTEDGDIRSGKRYLGVRVNVEQHDLAERFHSKAKVLHSGVNGETLLKAWSEGSEDKKHKFVRTAAEKVWKAAAEYIKGGEPSPSGPRNSASDFDADRFEASDLIDPRRAASPHAARGALGASLHASAREEGLEIVPYLVDWATTNSPKRPRVHALLGDFGMGKTVTCQLVRQVLRERRREDPTVPPALYFDLRKVRRPDDPSRIGLEYLLSEMLRFATGDQPSARNVIDYVRYHSALVIFDGLDEITNKLPPDVGRQIYRELLSIVPAELWRGDENRRRAPSSDPLGPIEGPSILVSCRSQYFASANAERGFLTDADRSELNDPASHIATFVMLPFTDEQKTDYLERNLDPDDVPRALSLIEGTHDLSGLSSRPVLLRYIGEMVPRLEREKLAGRPINIASVYDILVDQAFERDEPKHVMSVADKKDLLGALALNLHERGEEGLSDILLTRWLNLEIENHHPDLVRSKTGPGGLAMANLFVQDLRNATLLSRPGDTNFNFGHTSLREYFMANGLYKAVLEGRPQAWNIRPPSNETLDFILKRHEVEARPERRRFGERFQALIMEGSPLATRTLGFMLWLRAWRQGHPLPRPETLDASGLDLARSVLAGREGAQLPLENTVWSGANLRQAEFRDADLRGGVFDDADATAVRFVRCDTRGVSLDRAALVGSEWRDCRLDRDPRTRDLLHYATAERCQVGGIDWRPQPPVHLSAGAWRIERRCHVGPVTSVALGEVAGRAVVASGGDDGTVRLWDAAGGALLNTLEGHGDGVTSVALGEVAGRAVVASGGDDGTVRLWDAAGGALLNTLEGHGDGVTSVALGEVAGRAVVASGGYDGTVRLWDAAGGALLNTLEGHGGGVRSVALGEVAGRAVVASGGYDGTVRLWDAAGGALLNTLEGHGDGVTSVALGEVAGRAVVASGGNDGTVRLWDAAGGALLNTLEGHGDGVTSVALGEVAGRAVVASGGNDGTVRLWDAAGGALLNTLEGHKRGVRSAALGEVAGRAVVASGGYDGTVRLWDAAGGALLNTLEGHGGGVMSVALGEVAGGAVVASGGDDGTVRLWDAAGGALLNTLEGHKRGVRSVALGEVAGRAVVASGGNDGTVRLWDAAGGALLNTLEGHGDGVTSVALGEVAGRAVVASGGNDGTVRLWDAAGGALLNTLEGHKRGVRSAALGEVAGRAVVASGGNDGTVRLWDAAGGALLNTLEGHGGGVRSAALGEVAGRAVVASGGYDGTVRLWDAAGGALLNTLEGHGGGVMSVALGEVAGGAVVASGGDDGTVRLWDAAGGALLNTLEGHKRGVMSVALGEVAGRAVVASGGYDGTVRLTRLSNVDFHPDRQSIRFNDLRAGLDLSLCPSGEWRLDRCEDDAWREWRASYVVHGIRYLTGIEDMLRAKSRF